MSESALRVLTDEETQPHRTPWQKAIVQDFNPDKEEVYDGDTYTLHVDHGWDKWSTEIIRLTGLESLENPKIGVDAWEVRGVEREEGLKARDRVRELIPENSWVRIYSHKGGSRGSLNRWICIVCYKTDDGWVSIGDLLIQEGLAEEWWKGKSSGRPRPT